MWQRRSWETNRFSASQEIHRILWKPKFHYRTHKCLPPAPVLSQINPIHASTSHLLKNHFNIILPSTLPSCLFPLRFPHQNPVYTSPLPHTCYMSHISHFYKFIHPENTGWGVRIITSSLLGPIFKQLSYQHACKNTCIPYEITNRCNYMQSILFHC